VLPLIPWRRLTEDAFNHDLGLRVLGKYFDALTSLDANNIAGLFAEGGEIEDPVGSTLRPGRHAIAEYWATGLCAVASRIEIEVLVALPAGNSIAAHWRMTAQARSGGTADAEGIDVLRFDDHGLIHRAEG
jgi:SnoaL-like domain